MAGNRWNKSENQSNVEIKLTVRIISDEYSEFLMRTGAIRLNLEQKGQFSLTDLWLTDS